ncbi:hypothetical protein JQC67_01900 [Aurantibacter crassamenti]|uniref:hypothetical protein n=1 Tax=Aurantibacter crassamenti TaxID=1837375 RepID=UPI00193A449F|nr:hypothetical protein [Aurantibacter crassamenti]MBM1104880.1 hypothetical protein [Aurantibacter crassamenti]
MKIKGGIITRGLLLIALIMTSCQKEETENELFIESSQEEGFTSKTGYNDSELVSSLETLTPVLYKQYSGSLSREDAETSFLEEVHKFMIEEKSASKSEAFIYIKVAIRTDTDPHSQTDGNVWGRINFLTNNGDYQVPWFRLNDPSRNDFENGSWDFFYLKGHIPRSNWIEVKNATLALQGTDGWNVKWFDVHLQDDSRYSRASGRTDIYNNPEVWLDNTTNSGWDFYNTGNVGRGRLTF